MIPRGGSCMTMAERYFRQVVQRECCKPIECTHTLHDNRCENCHDNDDDDNAHNDNNMPMPPSHPLPPLDMMHTTTSACRATTQCNDVDIDATRRRRDDDCDSPASCCPRPLTHNTCMPSCVRVLPRPHSRYWCLWPRVMGLV